MQQSAPQTTATQDSLLTVKDLAKLSAESIATWRRRILSREIAVIKFDGNVRVRRSDFDAFVEARLRPAVAVAEVVQ